MSAEVINLSEVRTRRDERRCITGRARQNVKRALELLEQGAPAERVTPHLRRSLAQLDLMEATL